MLGSEFYDVNIYKCMPGHQGNQSVLVLVLKYWGLKTEKEGRTNFQCLMTAECSSEAWPLLFSMGLPS